MVKTTPFYPRTGPLNQTMLWEHWAGYLVAQKYQYSDTFEYYAIRNGVGLFDTSPLFKYRVKGPDATKVFKRCFGSGHTYLPARSCSIHDLV